MLQKNSYIIPSDNSFIKLVRIFHIFKKKKKFDNLNNKFGRGVVKLTSLRFKRLKKKKKIRFLIFRSNIFIKKIDGFRIKFNKVGVTCLKKRLNSKAKLIYGPVLREFKIKKFKTSFPIIITLLSSNWLRQ